LPGALHAQRARPRPQGSASGGGDAQFAPSLRRKPRIGIGGHLATAPCHTTGHAGRHRAVRGDSSRGTRDTETILGALEPRAQWRAVAHQLRTRFPKTKIGVLMDQAEADVLAFMTFPKAHRLQIHSTNTLERLNAEVKRRTDVAGIFLSEASITRLVGALLLE
jgi:hypothetical protein